MWFRPVFVWGLVLRINAEMEAVFQRFEAYSFATNQRFMDGLKSLNTPGESELLSLKLFFYNRFVEPIDQQNYRLWTSSRCASGSSEPQNRTIASHPDSSALQNKPAQTERKQLSFAEVMQLVQEGKEVPGVTKVDVTPSNRSPTPSQMQRVEKPWESASAS